MRLYIFILSFITFTNAAQVTFFVDMSEETVVAGEVSYPAVYVSGLNLNGPGWEGDNGLIEGGCAAGEYFDRIVSVNNSDIIEGVFCFGSCDENCFGDSIEYTLIWNDEFDGSGAIDPSKWFHQTQLPNGNSWFNNELQHYTNRLDNSYVSDGTLKIVAKKETYTDQGQTKEYTSARLNSKYAFTYGKVEIKAKLPEGVGTWPAIWMLGQNISEPGAYWQTQGYGTTSWPHCGEIDIMEHWGANQNYVQSALHTPSSYGATINHGGQYISNATTQFNVYTLEWTSEQMIFSVNGYVHYTCLLYTSPRPRDVEESRMPSSA